MRSLLLLSLFSLLLLVAGQPGQPRQNRMDIFNAPSSIPSSGTFSAVVNWQTNITGLVNLHLDLSDITASYAYDGGAFAQVTGPGAGFVTMILAITSGAGSLNVGDSYQLHAYMTANSDTLQYGNQNDYLHTKFDGYTAVKVSNAALPNTISIVNAPATIPNSGYALFDVYWSSSLPLYTLLHIDMNDATQAYAYDGGAFVNVTSPGSGIVSMNLSIVGGPLNLGDSYNLHVYMTSAANNTAHGTGNDWQYVTYDTNYPVKVAATSGLANSLTILNPPTYIPASGTFTVNCAWSTPIAGVMNLHVDISDITQSYAYDGGAMVQVSGPGSGTIAITVTITTTAASFDKMQLHTYMLDEITSESYVTAGSNNDYLHSLFDAYYPVSQGVQPTYPNYLTLYRVPTVLPGRLGSTINAVVEWSSNLATSTTIHLDLSDITQSYAYDGGVSIVVPSPGAGTVTLALTLTTALNAGDSYQLHAYMTSYANTTQYGAGNDYLHSAYDVYQPITVGNPNNLVNSITLLNVPNTIPSTGSIQVLVSYTSNIPNATVLHVDLSDVTQNYAYDSGASAVVASPGAGVMFMTLQLPTVALSTGDSYTLHSYMTSLANSTLYGSSNDWKNSVFDGYNTVTAAAATSFGISIVPINAPTVIPRNGNFTVQYAWSCNYTGELNLHLDLSDVTQAYAYDGGDVAQVTSPGSGVVTFTIVINTAALATSDNYQLHAYITPLTVSQQYGNGNDWQHQIVDNYTPVTAGNPVVPRYPNSLMFFQPPTTIPNSGYVSVVVEWASNAQTSATIHVDLSDITQAYAYDGGSATVVNTPGSGSFTVQVPITGTLNTGDSYQLHAYMTSYANTTQYGNTNDWQHTSVDLYQAVVVSSTPLQNTIQVLNAPTTIPQAGTILLDVAYTSNYPNSTTLHVDLSDITQSYAYDGGAAVVVPSPGSGIVSMSLTVGTSPTLALGDKYQLHAYMTSYANTTQYGNTNDWQHSGYDQYSPVTVAVATTLPLSLTPINAPSVVPNSGNFSVQYAWSSNYVGMLNLHLDLSDVTNNWYYDTGAMIQVTSPGSGVVTFVLNLGTQVLSPADSYDLHAYITPTSTGLINGTGQDWQTAIYHGYTTVTSSALTNSITFVQAPIVIPSSGYVIFTISYTTNLTTGLNLHVDLSDKTQAYAYETGFYQQVTAQTGTITVNFTIPASLNLNAGDSYDFHAYIASTAAANAGGTSFADWQNALGESYAYVTVAPGGVLTNTITLATTPTTIPYAGTVTFTTYWTSPYAGLLNLHVDISDVTQSYLYEGGAYAQVTGPGSGTVSMQLTLGSVTIKAGDSYTVHCYMTSQANSTAGGGTGNDYLYAAANSFYPVTASNAVASRNSLTLINPPASIPSSGSFTVQAQWQSTINGALNLHVDLSDITQAYAYDGGVVMQVYGPGSGQLAFTVPISASLPAADSYQIHTYITSQANSTLYGPTNDWQHTAYDGYYLVSSGSSSSSSSSKSLSGGAIAGIVIGVLAGVAILAVFLFFFVCGASSRSFKSSKMDDSDRATGAHSRHEDEQSHVGDVEMGETHNNEE